MSWTTDDLVDAVKRDIIAPSDEFQFDDQQILDIAWEETMKRLVPAVRAVREDYWTTTIDYAIAVGDTYKRIPPRANASTAASFWLVILGEPRPRRLRAFDSATRQRYIGQDTGQPTGYVLEGDKVYLYPPPDSASYTLRVQYDRRPSKYRLVSACGVVGGILGDVVSTTGGLFGASLSVDGFQADSPFDVCIQGATATYLTGNFTFATGTVAPSGLAVGDYIAAAGTTCVPPLPDVLHPALVDFTVAALWGKLGYTGKRDLVREDIETYFPGVIQQLAIRVSDDPDFAFNRESPLRMGGYPFLYGGRL